MPKANTPLEAMRSRGVGRTAPWPDRAAVDAAGLSVGLYARLQTIRVNGVEAVSMIGSRHAPGHSSERFGTRERTAIRPSEHAGASTNPYTSQHKEAHDDRQHHHDTPDAGTDDVDA
jgi:hypothetical protein